MKACRHRPAPQRRRYSRGAGRGAVRYIDLDVRTTWTLPEWEQATLMRPLLPRKNRQLLTVILEQATLQARVQWWQKLPTCDGSLFVSRVANVCVHLQIVQ